ncbi:MAG TPA: alpha/beta hydrolase [Dehalococcoidia bacterium]
MPDMDLGDVTIHYEEAAADKPMAIVFCHGLGGNGAGFVSHFDFWSPYFRCLTWDNRGLGKSSQAAKYNLPLYASDLARLMDKLGIAQAIVHGVSWGGVVVQQFALDYPEKCAAIVLDSTSSEVNVAASEGWYARGEAVKSGANANVPPEHRDSFIAEARTTASLREHPLTPRLKEIKCPTLVVGGGQDNVAGAAGSVILGRTIPGAKLEILQEAGHGIINQAPDRFRELVLAFAKENALL